MKGRISIILGIWMYVGYFLLVSYFIILPQIFVYILPFIHTYIPCKTFNYQRETCCGIRNVHFKPYNYHHIQFDNDDNLQDKAPIFLKIQSQ